MRFAPVAIAALLGGLAFSPGLGPPTYSEVTRKCVMGVASSAIMVAGATVAEVPESSFTVGSGCSVVPPAAVPSSIALRCQVETAGSAVIKATTTAAAGATTPAGTWCVEVRTVDASRQLAAVAAPL